MNARHAALLVPLLLLAAAGAAAAQAWSYKSYPRDRLSGQYLKDKWVEASITLDEKDGQASFMMITPGRGDPCFSNVRMPAEVERGPDVLVLTVKPQLAGCQPFRYRIRTDGSGGVRQFWRNDAWHDDGLDHGLTPK